MKKKKKNLIPVQGPTYYALASNWLNLEKKKKSLKVVLTLAICYGKLNSYPSGFP
jgi:hypothetical protein